MSHIRHVLMSLLCCVLLLSSARASAQDCGQYDRKEYDAYSARAEQQLTELEKLADGILARGAMTDEDGARNDSLTNDYAASMFSAYQVVYTAAELAAKSEGREGDARLTSDFELVASKHEPRTIALALKWEKIHAAITQGEIKQAALQRQEGSTSPVKQLTQEGLQQLTRRDDMVRPDFLKIAARGEAEQKSFVGSCKSAASVLGNFILPTAEAAQIAKCIGPCVAKNWGACLQCIGNAAPVVINAWNEFVGCWNSAGECKWYKPWNCAKKAWCLAKFIAVLA
jgi:hypothetical protein